MASTVHHMSVGLKLRFDAWPRHQRPRRKLFYGGMKIMKINAKVLAIRHLDFFDDAQRPVKGHQVFVSAPTNEKGWTQGVEMLKIWVPDGSAEEATAAALLPNDEINIDFNRRGKPVLVEL